jgi:dextranase
MNLLDLYPARGTYLPGEPVTLRAEIQAEAAAPGEVAVSIRHLARPLANLRCPAVLRPGRQVLTLTWAAPPEAPRGYGAEARLLDGTGQVRGTAETAFDVLPGWTAYPRYGFLTDFPPGRADLDATLDALARFHLNGLQFYDWQYRHDTLLPPERVYADPLGRRLSLDVVAGFIEAAHRHGMAALPYLAVYAGSAAFWREHPEWQLYDGDRRPIAFGEEFLGLMNPAPGGPWSRHLLDQCDQVLRALPFDGLHVDQYGEPHTAFDQGGRPVDLPAAFAAFVGALKDAHPGAAVLFNAVGNWPIEALAASAQDFAYIEVWPPATGYQEVQALIANARRLSGGKPAVIALYQPAGHAASLRLADALIFACGGTRIELGEGARLLADPYFPKHQALTPEIMSWLRSYYDFAVQYGEWLGPGAVGPLDRALEAPPGVWPVVRSAPGVVSVSLINFVGLGEPRWDVDLPAPAPLRDVPLALAWEGPAIRGAWWASPDGDGRLRPLDWTASAGQVRVRAPKLAYWTLLSFELEVEADA